VNLRRDDQIGCMLFWPVDIAESHRQSVTDDSSAG